MSSALEQMMIGVRAVSTCLRKVAPGGAVNLAVSARWTPTSEPPGDDAIDPIQAMQLAGHSRQTLYGARAPKQIAVRLR